MSSPTETSSPASKPDHSEGSDASLRRALATCLVLLRAGVAVVFLMWTIDKFVNPGHAAKVFEKFYMLPGMGAALAWAVGAAQLLVVLSFLAGWMKRFSYPIILVMHAVSTFSSFRQYIDPWTYPHLLFFAAIPMLAACFTLWKLQKHDTILSIDAIRS